MEDAEKEEKAKNPENPEILLTCDMSKQEWLGILNAIASDGILYGLKIHDVEENENSKFRAMVLEGLDENVIIFRGTSSDPEWIDNGQGGYSEITNNQKDALEYVQNIDLVNNNPFVISGHSKGGNLAQFVTLFATDTQIDHCLNFDGKTRKNDSSCQKKYISCQKYKIIK